MLANVRAKDLTPEMVCEISGCLQYIPDTGELLWSVNRGPRLAGSRAGTPTKTGYNMVHTSCGSFLSHRLAYALYHGELDGGICIDHIDRDKSNNRINNLRAVSHATNMQNQDKPRADNTSGYRGVHSQTFANGGVRFYATTKVNGKTFRVTGGRSTALEAYIALEELKQSLLSGVLYTPDDRPCPKKAEYTPTPPKPRTLQPASGVTGVYHRKDSGKWHAKIMRDGVQYDLGSTYGSFKEAKDARDSANMWWATHGTMHGHPFARALYSKRGNVRARIDNTNTQVTYEDRDV